MHLLLIPFIDLPLACTILGVLVLAPLYIYMIFDAELSQAQGPTPGWCMLAARAVGYMAAWLVGVGFMQALMMKDEEEGVTHGWVPPAQKTAQQLHILPSDYGLGAGVEWLG